ncbi:set domain [Plasmopara halstedii]|uniref:Set domain n=1 Tax=Plasmopara halstedii TaxID=4781 RepID=A0A0P1AW87_PLAHL|nr:set domain [Plasmopara halstedii]CEG46066.1 set domain [Plasmopara halstedii]|eukprot:XP_024582435.1 set domain [Plasmopara halstedii]
MAFRGALLQLMEAEKGFNVLAPDAKLMLPPRLTSVNENLLTQWSQQKLVVMDSVTHKLHQVARLATVRLQREEKSLLWGVRSTFGPPKSRTVGSAPLERYSYPPQSVIMPHEITADAKHKNTPLFVASTSLSAQIDASSEPTTGTTEIAFTRMQQYALTQRSVMMELEIIQEAKKRSGEERIRLQVASSKAKKRQEREVIDKLEKPNKNPKQIQIKNKPKIMAATPANKIICVLCRMQRMNEGPAFSKHPFVLKDGKGEVVYICKVCLQHVLQKRLSAPPVAKKGIMDVYCGLCARLTEDLPTKSFKVCTHKLCTRVYCLPCIDKLIGRAQSHKVWRTKNWLCPNCSIDNDNASSARNETIGAISSVVTSPTTSTKIKKRKRCHRIDDHTTAETDEPEPSELAEVTSGMEPIDYAVMYFKFLLKREMKAQFVESEDVCFCCKDGGDVIECDWKGMNGAFARCPKVYHEECLGYEVPDGKTWVCPRHRCQDCGIIAQYSCRFCVTSYCEEHLSKEVQMLGTATSDIPTSTYIMCIRCNNQARDALRQKKIVPNLFSQLLRQQAHKLRKG